jgi:hypothetical protein
MWLILLLCFSPQEDLQITPESVNAQVFFQGRQLDLIDVRIKGVESYAFEFYVDGSSTQVSLFRVARITRQPDSNDFAVLFDNGETKVGRIRSISFSGNPDAETGKREIYHLNHLERIHFIHGNQLRSCAQGHFESYTPHPFCPICGNELAIGPYEEDQPEVQPQPPIHRLRLDSRDPSNSATRRPP